MQKSLRWIRRNAAYGPLAAHSVGYVGEVSKEQLASERYQNFRQGDRVGQFGIEQAYDTLIRGVPGQKWIEVNVVGQELNLLRINKPVEGDDIFLTLDLDLQKVAEEALGEEAGSIVAIDPTNGEILALVSHPAFNPNDLSEGTSAGTLLSLLNDKGRPLMNRAGLGKPTGIPLASEKSGLIPSTVWKQKVLKEPWYPGETLSVSIGQGYVLVTPLQMAAMISAVANDGILYTPRLLLKSKSRQTGEYQAVPVATGAKVPISKETLGIIKSALADVVATPHGTAYGSRSALIPFAGKTGTAQVVVMKKGEVKKALSKEVNDHAWFVSYAPVDNPKIAVVVLVEHGGHGGSAAAPLAKRVIEAYLAPSKQPSL
ncbi:MAG: hypothetical protein HY201_00055 [Nitrospirae bacterium]|nr:hypothetical protein [Candidatus Troglogloeales bacterium]